MSAENKELFIEYEETKELDFNSYLLMSSNKLYYIQTIYTCKYKIFDMFIFNEKDLCFKYQLEKDIQDKEDGYMLKFIKWVEKDDKYLTTIKWIENHVVVDEYQFTEKIKKINYELVEKYKNSGSPFANRQT
jgi:hypothetical protein